MADLKSFLAKSNCVLLDVRGRDEFADGHAPGSVNVPHTEIHDNLDKLPSNKATPICCYCAHGRRGGIAEDALKQLGYTQTLNGQKWHEVAAALEEVKK